MEIFSLVELFELHVNCLSLVYIGFHGKIFLIFLCDEILEFLLDFQVWKPLLQPTDLMLKKLRQVIRDLLIGVKSKHVLRRAETDLELLPQPIFLWRTVLVKCYFEQRLDDEWREEVIIGKEVFPKLLESVWPE